MRRVLGFGHLLLELQQVFQLQAVYGILWRSLVLSEAFWRFLALFGASWRSLVS